MEENSSVLAAFHRLSDRQSTQQGQHLFELLRLDMSQIWEVKLAMSNDEVS